MQYMSKKYVVVDYLALTKDEWSSVRCLKRSVSDIWVKYLYFYSKHIFQYAIGKMPAILCRLQYAKHNTTQRIGLYTP